MPVIINGTTGISGVDGTAASPAIEGSDTNTGMFFPAADTIAFAEGGVEVLRMNSSTQIEFLAGTASLPTITASGDLNTGIFFPAADSIAFTAGGTEEFRIGPAGQLGIQGANYGTTGQVLTSGGASASPSWAMPSSITLLGSVSTTTGTNPVLSGLTLTSYKLLLIVFKAVSHNDAATRSILVGNSTADDISVTNTLVAANFARGFIWIDLSDGTYSGAVGSLASASNIAGTPNANAGDTPITTASTAVSFALSGTGSFDAGSIDVYGVA